MTHSVRRLPLALLLVTAVLVAGCAQDRIRDEAASQLREGHYEAALQSYQTGIRDYPDNTSLRSGYATVRGEAVARLVTEASQMRAQNNYDAADKALIRALALEPKNERILALQTEVASDRRRRERMEQANALEAAGNKEAALRVLETAMRDAPRQGELVEMHRRLELAMRAERDGSGRRTLAESKTVTLDFRGAPLATVLDAITRSSGINFILDRDVKSDARVTVYLRAAKVSDAIDLIVGAQQLAQRTVDAQTILIYPNTVEKQREHQEQVIRVFHLGSAEAKTTAALLRSMLRIKEPFVDERANLIAIRESPEIVALAERLVALHDVGDAEVMLEVEILEVRTGRLTELGINFPNTISLTPLPLPGATGQTLSSLSNLNPDRIGVSVAGLLLNLRREVGDFNILANPRIRTKSHEKARIVIGDKVPLVTATTGSNGFVADTVSYLDVGLKLEVEPVVSPDDDVTIKLGLEVSSLAREVRTTSGTLAYQIGTRNANTTLRLRDGETQLLGGLISNEDRKSANRVPGLGDLPIAGRLFSSQLDNVQRTELILAITPRIVRSAPRPDIAQAELWVGTEQATRLRPTPDFTAPAKITSSAAIPASGTTVQSPLPTSDKALPPTVIATWAAPSNAKVGDEIVVQLNLSSGTPLRGSPVELRYPADLFDIVDVAEGPFFRQNEGATSFTNTVNAQTGVIGAVVMRPDATGATGQATLLSIRLRSKKAGQGTVTISSFKPIGLVGVPPVADLPVLRLSAQ